VQFFAHILFVNHAFNVTPRSGNKTIHCKIFAETGFLLEKVQLKLMMSHLQQLFILHWYRRLGRNNDYSTYQHGRQMDFSMESPKKLFQGANSGEN